MTFDEAIVALYTLSTGEMEKYILVLKREHKKGRGEGYSKGYKDGYEAGFGAGHKGGYDQGHEDAY